MHRCDEEARWAPSRGESATRLSSYPTRCLPLACRLIGRTVACAEHIGKAIRKLAGNRVARTFAIVSRDISWKRTAISYWSTFYCAKCRLFRKHACDSLSLKKNKKNIYFCCVLQSIKWIYLLSPGIKQDFLHTSFTSESCTTNSKANDRRKFWL